MEIKIPRLSSNCFRTGREHTLIFCDGPQRPETVNGCPVLRRQEPPPRGTRARLRVPTGSTVRAPPKRASGESFSPLTKTGSKIAFVMPDFLEVRLDSQGF